MEGRCPVSHDVALAPRRCTAPNRRTGEQCGRRPIPGGTVCAVHGGKHPAVQAKAKQRLLAMVEPVLAAFDEIVESWHRTRCDKCGHPTGDPKPVIQVGKLVLDRTGFGPTMKLEIQPTSAANDLREMPIEQAVVEAHAIAEELSMLLEERNRRKALPPAIEGEVIDSDQG